MNKEGQTEKLSSLNLEASLLKKKKKSNGSRFKNYDSILLSETSFTVVTMATALSISMFAKLRQDSRKENRARKGVCTWKAHTTFTGSLQAECNNLNNFSHDSLNPKH